MVAVAQAGDLGAVVVGVPRLVGGYEGVGTLGCVLNGVLVGVVLRTDEPELDVPQLRRDLFRDSY